MVIFMTSLSSSKTEFACVFYDVFGVGGFTGLIQGRVLTIFLWAFSHLLLIDISVNILLAHVVSFPTNLVSLNSESVCRSCGCFGKGCSGTTAARGDVTFYYRSRAVLPRLLSGSTAPDQNLVFFSVEVGTEVFFLYRSQAVVPLPFAVVP